MKQITLILLTLLFLAVSGIAQEKEKKADSSYQFTVVKQLPATSIKNQNRSGTCWSYSAIAFLESELLRTGKDTFDLSEMYCVRQCYSDKARIYVRFEGKHNFGGGGAAHDVTYVLKNYGMVPEEAFTGLTIGEKLPVHGEMDAVLSAYVDAVIKNPNKKLTPVWHAGFDGILDAYLGKVPGQFTYKGKTYTPQTFADMMGLNPDNYVELTSYTHHPFYSRFILEVPDNWLMESDYNVPVNDLMNIIDNSIQNGYTIVWGADVSEKGFSWKNGVAIVPDKNAPELAGLEQAKWEKMTDAEKDKLLYKFDKPVPEKKITQEMRQVEFDNYQTTDDHGMQITGIAKDQNGNKYYIIKNSWGLDDHKYKGYFYASEAYVMLKTMDIMVHKNAIPQEIRKKLGL
ncbi:MAG: aminopeptidase [Bacteroidetes bacterium]|nr:aminopeptidase [Bacteroidota bacterium]